MAFRRFMASDGAADDQYGSAQVISANGSVMVVGAPNTANGKVYVYHGLNLVTETILTASDAAAGDYFGTTVAVSDDGSVIVVGAPLSNNGGTDRGAAYVYFGVDWGTETKLSASDKADGDSFGNSVSINADGTLIVVGAPNEGGAGSNRGKVYRYSGASWATEATLTASDAANSDFLGSHVRVSADSAVIIASAIGKDNGGTNRGGVYVFSGALYATETQLTASDASDDAAFGYGIDVSGDGGTIVVGALIQQAYVFSGASWATEAIIPDPTPVLGDGEGFGSSVAISPDGQTVAVSDPVEDVGTITAAGVIRLYAGVSWVTIRVLTRTDAAAQDQLGYETIDLTNDYLVAGTPYGGARPKGASYVWEPDVTGPATGLVSA